MCEVYITHQLGNRAEYKAFALYLAKYNTATQPASLSNIKHVFIIISIKARLHGSPRLINAVESTKVNRVNSSFQRK